MTTDRTHEIIPEGELPCIWMEAGTVGFKLCDREYNCEHCPFDRVIRQQLHHSASKSTIEQEASRPVAHAAIEPSQLVEYLDSQLESLLRPFVQSSLPTDRLYAANHLWVLGNESQNITVGIDHLLLHLLGSVHSVAFLSTPAHAHATSPCSWIIHRHGTIALKIPLPGTITQTNARLTENPSLLNHQPYGEGWMFRLTADTVEQNSSTLLPSEKAAAVFLQQAKTLCTELRASLVEKRTAVGSTLYDGGNRIENVEDIVGPKVYFQLVTRLLAFG